MAKDLRVLVVEDSPFCAEAIACALEEEPGIRVVGFAHDGRQAVELAGRLRPDLMTLDVQMPVMDGLEALRQIMLLHPTRVLVYTGDPRGRSGELIFEAISCGALDLLAKADLAQPAERRTLRERIRLLAGVQLPPHPSRRPEASADQGARPQSQLAGVVGIVASTGGPSALEAVVSRLPADFPAAILIVQHLPQGFAQSFAGWLSSSGPLQVVLADHGDELRPGRIAIAPDSHHLVVERDRLRLERAVPSPGGHCPSGTVLLRSIARAWGPRGAGVVLTGMGEDGCEGLAEIRRAGGPTFAQDAATSILDGMPAVARKSGAAGEVLALDAVGARLARLARSWADAGAVRI